ncbi:hypothetical protein VNI00_012041 [Paramarasmius palmivorus]|uniref:HAD-like protein n=1 Tax=Paramarasmius palmivorus TaxID=297713 RepID=A0AAW0C7F4_9AGAR
MPTEHTFYADAVLFDMDGTLTDSISAVEAAWGKVANDIGQDPAKVIAATHGKRAIDNLAQFKPEIPAHAMDEEVQKFEESILYFADAYHLHGPGANPPENTFPSSGASSDASTPALSVSGSSPSSRSSSFAASDARRPSFGSRLESNLQRAASEPRIVDLSRNDYEDAIVEGTQELQPKDKQVVQDELEAWQIEAAGVDRSVRILPGVKKMIESIPDGRWAVATSGARTYAYGCMTRVGIEPPPVTVTADDKRLKAGKPAPDPFLLAAKRLGYDIKNCVVFEDSPSGIRAGVASGATVIAVCTSHEREKIEGLGAHYIVENMDFVKCEVDPETNKLKFTVQA